MYIKASEETEKSEQNIPDEATPEEPESMESLAEVRPEPGKKRFETSKLVVWVCLINGILWVWCSYILAWLDKVQIAESLSQVAVTEIIGVVLVHCLKTVVENLSKNNNWPDKATTDCSDGVG